MRTSILFTLAVSLTVLASVVSAGEIHGTVHDPSGDVVPGVVVTLYDRESGAERSTRSDVRGTYEFNGVGGGSYLVRASADGFAPESEPVALASEAIVVHEVRLSLASVRTEVAVTASGTPLMLEEVAKTTDVVTAEDISLRGTNSLGEALRLVPGFRVRQSGGPGNLTVIRVRGLRTYDTALLIDGLRMRDATDLQGSAIPFLEDMVTVATARAEVLRGSGSSLYGSHAIGGVVNLVTETGGGSPRGEVMAEGGGLGAVRGLAKLSGGLIDNRLLYAGGISHWNVTRGFDDANPYRNTTGHGFARYMFSPDVSASVRLLASDSFVQLTDSPFVPAEMEVNHPASGLIPAVPLPDAQVRLVEQGLPYSIGGATYVPSLNDPDDRRSGDFWNVAAIFAHQVSAGTSWRASYQWLGSSRLHQAGPAGQRFEPAEYANASTFIGGIHTVQLRGDFELGRYNLVTAGYEFEDETYENTNTDETPDPALRPFDRSTIEQRSHAAFVQDQVRLLDGRLRIALSGRVQGFRLDEPRFEGGSSPYAGVAVESPPSAYTGDAAVSYLIRSTGTKWRAHVGNSYRAASLFERFGTSYFFGAFSPFGDPRLRPERAVSVDTGLDKYLAGSRVRLGATFFYTNIQEIIYFDFSGLIPPDDPFGRFGGYLNVAGGLSRGVELSMNANPARGSRIDASYTYTNSKERVPWDAFGETLRVRGISDHMFTLLVSQQLGSRWRATFDLFAASDYVAALSTSAGSRPFVFDGPVKADAVVSYTIPIGDVKRLEIQTKIDNLLNRNLYEDGFRTPGIVANGGLRFLF